MGKWLFCCALMVSAPSRAGESFVVVALDARGDDALKDAVAGLERAAGFRQDARFPPERFADAAAPRVALRGWIPTSRIGEAARAPGVLRLELDRLAARASPAPAAAASVLVGIRIPAQAPAAETFQRVVSELAASAQFRWTRMVGFQAIPGSKDLALLVVGDIPIARLSRMMAHPGVLKIGPAPPQLPVAAAPPPASAAPPPPRAARFASFVSARAPYLLILTLLLMIPVAGGPLLRLLKTFIPYNS